MNLEDARAQVNKNQRLLNELVFLKKEINLLKQIHFSEPRKSQYNSGAYDVNNTGMRDSRMGHQALHTIEESSSVQQS